MLWKRPRRYIVCAMRAPSGGQQSYVSPSAAFNRAHGDIRDACVEFVPPSTPAAFRIELVNQFSAAVGWPAAAITLLSVSEV